jgi:hypothetical protein
MGLALRYNLFHGVDAKAVYGALAGYWASLRHGLAERTPRTPPLRATDEYVLHAERAGWTLLSWDGGWEWTRRREAQLHVSRALGCVGLLVFVYDGQCWGYELFDRGAVMDVTALPDRALEAGEVEAVLRRRARPHGHGALDLLRLLGVDLEVAEADEPWWYVVPAAARWRAFAVVMR